jgi:hypothetical protein
VLTSPPFRALRSYLPDDDPAKAHEIGSESTPGAFLDVLLDVVEACGRILAPHGSIAVELGDTYAGSNEAGWHRSKPEHLTLGRVNISPSAECGATRRAQRSAISPPVGRSTSR